MKRLLLLTLLAVCSAISGYAYDFYSDGIYYIIGENNTVSVTSGDTKYEGEIIIPSEVTYNSVSYNVASIEFMAFSGCSGLILLTIPNSVTSIDNSAFINCSGLTSITIPNSVTSIGEHAFMGCSGLTSIMVSGGNTKYDSRNNCNAIIETSSNTLITGCKNTIIPNSVTSIDDSAFYNCSGLTSITIPNSVTSIGDGAFNSCTGLTSITIPNSVTSIGNRTFEGCSGLTSISLSNTLKTIGEYAFSSCNFEFFDIPDNLINVSQGLFSKCKNLRRITIPNSITDIGIWAFEGCTNLNIVLIGNSINAISFFAFQDCKNLQDIYCFAETIPYTSSEAFRGVDKSRVTLHVPEQVIDNYKNEEPWNRFEKILPLDKNINNYSTLDIIVSGSGTVLYDNCQFRRETQPFIVEEGKEITLSLNTDYDCELLAFKINGFDVLKDISNNQYTNKVSANTVIEIEFDSHTIGGHDYIDMGLPSGKYWSTVNYGAKYPEDAGTYMSSSSSTGWGEYWKTPTKEDMQELIDECKWVWTEKNGRSGFEITGINGNKMFLPAAGYYDYDNHILNEIKSQIDGSLVQEYFDVNKVAYYYVDSDIYSIGEKSGIFFSKKSLGTLCYVPIRPISKIKNESVFTKDGIIYSIVSSEDRTVNVTKGNYGNVLDIPATITHLDKEWHVVGIDDDVLADNTDISAIIWSPEVIFTKSVSNPNLLLYVKSESYAPSSISNVIVNGYANEIILKDAENGNNFFCPQSFTAKNISYTHNYNMQTGIGISRGWETIALPFDVQKVKHQSKGEIVPFASRNNGDSRKPFWLMQLSNNGWQPANNLQAYTPYIISMPNNDNYNSEYLLNGSVTFSSENVNVLKTENLIISYYNGKTFVPNFRGQNEDGLYALNVNNDYVTYQGSNDEGSTFFFNLRAVYPFEAYMTTSSTNAPESISIFDDMTTGIQMMVDGNWTKEEVVYDLQGRKVNAPSKKGVYIINGKKLMIK